MRFSSRPLVAAGGVGGATSRNVIKSRSCSGESVLVELLSGMSETPNCFIPAMSARGTSINCPPACPKVTLVGFSESSTAVNSEPSLRLQV